MNACEVCGTEHGPGNTNTLCPYSSDYELPHVVSESEVEWFQGIRVRVVQLSDGRRIIPTEELAKLGIVLAPEVVDGS